MIRPLSFGVALLAVAMATAGAAEPQGADLKPLHALDWLIGDWVGQYDAPVDLLDVKQGQRVTSHVSRRWVLQKNAFDMDAVLETDEVKIPLSHEVNYFDPQRGKVAMWAQTSLGTGSGVFTSVAQDRAVLQFAIHQEGVLAGTAVLERLDADSYTWQLTDITLDGEKTPDWPKVTYRRKTGVPAGSLWEAYRTVAAGTWKGEGIIMRDNARLGLTKGDRFQATSSLVPELDGNVLTGDATFEIAGKPQRWNTRILAGWDPDRQQIRFLCHWSSGLLEEIILTNQRGDVFLGTYTAKLDGNPTRRARMSVQFTDRDRCVYKFLDGQNQGEVLSTWQRQ
jgi:hypothetical protein